MPPLARIEMACFLRRKGMDSKPRLLPIPGYRAGAWTADAARTNIAFSVRQLQISKVRGRLTRYDLKIVTAEDPLHSCVDAAIDLSSIDTGNRRRDDHLRSAAILNIEEYPTMSYHSTGLRQAGTGWIVDGELALHGSVRKVSLSVATSRFARDSDSSYRADFFATAEINRSDFGIAVPLEGGGLVIADKVSITLRIRAILNS